MTAEESVYNHGDIIYTHDTDVFNMFFTFHIESPRS